MRNFKELIVWKKAHLLCLEVYKITNDYPNEEKFGLISQLRRASSSIPTNIAEGGGYQAQKEFGRFLRIASGSASEVEYQLLLSRDLKFVLQEKFEELTKEVIIIRKNAL